MSVGFHDLRFGAFFFGCDFGFGADFLDSTITVFCFSPRNTPPNSADIKAIAKRNKTQDEAKSAHNETEKTATHEHDK